jgi:hypothetical protein
VSFRAVKHQSATTCTVGAGQNRSIEQCVFWRKRSCEAAYAFAFVEAKCGEIHQVLHGGRCCLAQNVRGLTYESERWCLATVGDWSPSGSHLPQPEVTEKLQAFCRELFDLFDGGASAPPGCQAA